MKRSHDSIFAVIIGSILKAFSLVVRERFHKDEFTLVHEALFIRLKLGYPRSLHTRNDDYLRETAVCRKYGA